jgi:hypothetical protein
MGTHGLDRVLTTSSSFDRQGVAMLVDAVPTKKELRINL